MEIRWITDEGARLIDRDGLVPALASVLSRDHGVVWVDLFSGEPGARELLGDLFGCDPRAVEDCERRNATPKLHLYGDSAFLVLHVPDPERSGHVHSIELDLFVHRRYVITVHGPVNPSLDPAKALVETGAVARRLDQGRWRPTSVDDLVHAIVTGLNRRMDQQLAELRLTTWDLERVVTSGTIGDPEDFLERMFAVRLGLQAIRTIAALDHEVYDRMGRLHVIEHESPDLVADSVDQFERIMTSADVQTDYLEGVIQFYQTRINTKMTVAAERLAVIAAVTLPVTAVSSVVGMNVVVSRGTHWVALSVLLAAMGAMSAALLVWAKRQGWW